MNVKIKRKVRVVLDDATQSKIAMVAAQGMIDLADREEVVRAGVDVLLASLPLDRTLVNLEEHVQSVKVGFLHASNVPAISTHNVGSMGGAPSGHGHIGVNAPTDTDKSAPKDAVAIESIEIADIMQSLLDTNDVSGAVDVIEIAYAHMGADQRTEFVECLASRRLVGSAD